MGTSSSFFFSGLTRVFTMALAMPFPFCSHVSFSFSGSPKVRGAPHLSHLELFPFVIGDHGKDFKLSLNEV